jgi:hypothetical protein
MAGLIYSIYGGFKGEKLIFKTIFFKSIKGYLSFLFVYILQISLAWLLFKSAFSLDASIYFATKNKILYQIVKIFIPFVGLCFINTLFFFAYPIIVLKTQRAYKAIISGIKYLKGIFFRTLFLISLITLLYYSVTIVRYLIIPKNIWKLHPEISIIAVGVYAFTLFIVDGLLYSLSTLIYLQHDYSDKGR